jgi:hypothetical protein
MLRVLLLLTALAPGQGDPTPDAPRFVLDREGVVRFAACPVGPYLEKQIRLAAE